MTELSLFEQGHQAKALIEKYAQFSERLTGVFFRKHFGESMLDATGRLTAFAEACFAYFNELTAKPESSDDTLERKHLQHQASIKLENASIKRSRHAARARFIGSLRYTVTDKDQMTITTNARSVSKVSTQIRRYLKALGIRHLGKSLSNGVQFSGDAVTAILALLAQRHQSASYPAVKDDALLTVQHIMSRFLSFFDWPRSRFSSFVSLEAC